MASLTVTQADLGLSPSHRIVVSLIVGSDYSHNKSPRYYITKDCISIRKSAKECLELLQ
jgi:hypothetical protein